MGEPACNSGKSEKRTSSLQAGYLLKGLACLVIGLLVVALSLGPIGHGRGFFFTNNAVQKARTIGLALFQYSNDHNGKFPSGKSSTEVFQALMDGSYVTDPTLFFLPFPHKTLAVADARLRPENVCFDVTGGADSRTPGTVPLVYSTGYRVAFAPGGSAVALPRNDSFLDRLFLFREINSESAIVPGIAVCYAKTFNCKFKFPGLPGVPRQVPDDDPQVVVPGILSSDFMSDGRSYVQLTPDGPMP